MTRDSEELPRWVQRREGRSAGRYVGDKVVRWIARPTLRARIGGAAAADGASATPEWSRGGGGFGPLRLVSDN